MTRCRCNHRRGATLIDVAAGSMLLAVVLIPSVKMLQQNESLHRRSLLRETMLHEAEQLLEQSKIRLTDPSVFDSTFRRSRPVVQNLSLTATDGPSLRATLTTAADATLPAGMEVITIDALVWRDVNNNRRCDIDEPAESLRTQRAAP
ncbi:hypothetical protein [Crateriforma conspicua]|uniref:Uncharacterized protein n=1 Tax=Crateriforma conspicua TaxID=2527996 RepID=A0A5C5Y9D6_9PLAN|nr:hypothetical protein [Crateriforma conspicua]QDV61779.1 hypothetical protein Mal65_09060 [Crateriforma conspicua]TWT71970.1 hypothetical protein Pan14r_42870 [Crateriforma conspicua]